jgi:ribonucleoside-diphosphate reductase beta chain
MLAGYDHLLRAAARLQWDERAIDLTVDAGRWPGLPPQRRARIRDLVTGFCLAEAAVAEHLAPFEAAAGGALADCLAQQAVDERRHARFFARVEREIIHPSPPGAVSPALERLFCAELPARAAAAADGLDGAVGFYHLVLEGLVFAAGQEALLALAHDLPGLHAGVSRVQADERWHVGLGVTALQELGCDGQGFDEVVELAGRAWPGVSVNTAVHARRLALLRRTVLRA